MGETIPRKKVLLVDDDHSLLEVVRKRLETWGFEALCAASGEEGIRMAEAEQPDLILLDIMMPKMKGRDVCKRLKVSPKVQHIPVIFLSALGMTGHVKAGMDLGAEDYVTKPYDPEDLKRRVTECLLRHSTDVEKRTS